jgi:enoyl-[acyl-carrier protein] reductase II
VLHTAVCDLLGIDYPIIQAGMGPFTSAELAAAVSNAGALGTLGTGARPAQGFKDHLARLRRLMRRPFAVNFVLSPVLPDPELFALTLGAGARLVSFALGDPAEYIGPAHDAGTLVMQQVTTVQQAQRAAEAGVGIIIAQGSEAGGFGGVVSALVLIPQVVDAVRPVPVPVVAAGGIADGRGLAAALVLGAQGVNLGTRFLASAEAPAARAGNKPFWQPSRRTPSRSTSGLASFRLQPEPRAAHVLCPERVCRQRIQTTNRRIAPIGTEFVYSLSERSSPYSLTARSRIR